MVNWLVASAHLKNISQIGSFPQIGMKIKNIWNHHLVNCWFGARWFGARWFGFLESPKMKGIGNLGCTPRIPNHRDPNRRLTISWRIVSKKNSLTKGEPEKRKSYQNWKKRLLKLFPSWATLLKERQPLKALVPIHVTEFGMVTLALSIMELWWRAFRSKLILIGHVLNKMVSGKGWVIRITRVPLMCYRKIQLAKSKQIIVQATIEVNSIYIYHLHHQFPTYKYLKLQVILERFPKRAHITWVPLEYRVI